MIPQRAGTRLRSGFHAPAPSPAERFLGALTPTLRQQIALLVSARPQLAESVCIFTARKSACIAEALQRTGLWQLPPRFRSTRALDGDLSDLAGESVVLIDDIALSGRTLRKSIELVRNAGAKTVEIAALTIEGGQAEWERSLDCRFLFAPVDASPGDSIVHAQSLVDAFRSLSLPYNIDWPIARWTGPGSPIDELARAGWVIDRHDEWSTTVEASRQVHRETLALSVPWIREVKSRLQFAKFRIYRIQQPQPGGTKYFVVPIVALGDMSPEDIHRLVKEVRMSLATERPVMLTVTGAVEAYRVLQYVLSFMMMRLAFRGRSDRFDLDTRVLRYLFSPSLCEQLEALEPEIDRTVKSLVNNRSKPREVVVRGQIELVRAGLMKQAAAAAADGILSQAVLSGYLSSQEYHLRQALRISEHDADERSRLSTELADLPVVEDGSTFDFRSLRTVLARAAVNVPELSQRQMVSEFLDHAIDSGEVVPTTVAAGGLVGRRFRAGEVLEFRRDAQALAESALRSFAAQRVRNRVDSPSDATAARLSSDDIQKVVVGLSRLLLRTRDAEDKRAQLSQQNSQTDLQFKYHLRGLVLSDLAGGFVADGLPTSVTRLVQHRVLKQVRGGYELPEVRQLPIPSAANHTAVVFGECAGRLFGLRGPDGKRLVDSSSFARLVTLVDAEDQILALAADVVIAMDHLTRRFHSADELRTSALVEAINQGLAKAAWVVSERSQAVLDAASAHFDESSEALMASAWGLVRSSLERRQLTSSQTRLFDEFAVWLVRAVVFADGLEMYLARDGTRKRARLSQTKHFRPLADRTPAALTLGSAALALFNALGAVAADASSIGPLLERAKHELLNTGLAPLTEAYDLSLVSSGIVPKQSSWPSCVLIQSGIKWHRHVDRDTRGSSAPPIRFYPDSSGVVAPFDAIARLSPSGDITQQIDDVVRYVSGLSSIAAPRFLACLELPVGFRPGPVDDVLQFTRGFTDLVKRALPIVEARQAGVIAVSPPNWQKPKSLADRLDTPTPFECFGRTWEAARVLAPPQPDLFTQGAVIMGDVYKNYGNAGNFGPGGTNHGNVGGSYDVKVLAAELRTLLTAMGDDSSYEPDVILGALESADQLESEEVVLSKLRRLSQRSLALARDIGVEVAAATISKALGL